MVSLILRLGAMTVFTQAECISLCHSLEERMDFWQSGSSHTIMYMGGIGHALSICLDSCGIGQEHPSWRPCELHQSMRVDASFAILHSRAVLPPSLWTMGER